MTYQGKNINRYVVKHFLLIQVKMKEKVLLEVDPKV